jgi:putative transposase
MKCISYARHRFPPDVIRHAVWLYLRFTLSYRDVEDLLAERGLEVSNESIRRWVLKFGSAIARNLRSIRPRPHDHWHLDEMVVSIGGQRMYMWRAVDGEGEVLDVLIQRSRDKAAALKLLRKLLKKQGVRRQSFWDGRRLKIREALARLVCGVMRPADGAAGGDWRWSVV